MPNTQAVEQVDVNTDDNAVQQAVAALVTNQAGENQLDAYGRDAAERTVELNSHVAAAANAVVEQNDEEFAQVLTQLKAEYEGGTPTTFDDAIGYIVYRGCAEIKRQREAAASLKEKSKLAANSKLYGEMLKVNPALVTDPDFVAKMVAALVKPATK